MDEALGQLIREEAEIQELRKREGCLIHGGPADTFEMVNELLEQDFYEQQKAEIEAEHAYEKEQDRWAWFHQRDERDEGFEW